MNPEEDERIDFSKEVEEFITQKLIKSAEVLETTPVTAKMKLVTLEDVEMYLECSTTMGLVITKIEGVELKATKFDSFEQLLNAYSPAYKKKFSDLLMQKLSSLQQDDQESK